MDGLANEAFDVAIIGGGITGAGIARDAAMRGLKTVLFERNDLGSGTSSASSKLVHGGLRYLEHGAVGLVFESVSERHRLRQLAPHLVRPLPFLLPVYRGKPRPLWLTSLALWIYDGLALFRTYRLHETFGAARTLALMPGLADSGLDGSVYYYDCLTDDARLTLETARSAHEAGAWVLPYTQVDDFIVHRGQVGGVIATDRRTGNAHEVRARVVVNATGPWTDRTRGLRGQRERMLRPTKGIHIVVPRKRLPVDSAVMLWNPEDRRVAFVIPAGPSVFVGTTDTDYEGDFDAVRAEGDEVDYLLALVGRYFPETRVSRSDIVGSWAGLRPLIHTPDVSAGAVPREHEIRVDDDGLITIAGGKLTTYRLMAAEVVDRIGKRLRADSVHVGGCPTGTVALPGGRGIAWIGDQLRTLGADGADIDREGVDRFGAAVVAHLKETYGGRWLAVLSRIAERPDGGRRIDPELPYLWAEVDLAIEEEMAVTLSDVMRRRMQLQIRAADQGTGVAPAVAARMGELLGWSAASRDGQVALYRAEVAQSMAWRESRGA
jgi:glycerol-3-phosphate dehydrogenase